MSWPLEGGGAPCCGGARWWIPVEDDLQLIWTAACVTHQRSAPPPEAAGRWLAGTHGRSSRTLRRSRLPRGGGDGSDRVLAHRRPHGRGRWTCFISAMAIPSSIVLDSKRVSKTSSSPSTFAASSKPQLLARGPRAVWWSWAEMVGSICHPSAPVVSKPHTLPVQRVEKDVSEALAVVDGDLGLEV